MKITTVRRVVAVGFVALALAACAAPGPVPTTMAMAPAPALGLAVSEVRVASDFKAPMTAPHVESEMPVALDAQVQDWAKSSLTARGGKAVARFTITDASVVETPLTPAEGLPGMFRTPQNVRFDATIAGTLEIVDAAGKRLAYADARVSDSQTFTAGLSKESLKMRLQDVADLVLPKFEAAMVQNIRDHAGAYVTP